MSASHTDITSKAHNTKTVSGCKLPHPSVPTNAPNLPNLLSQHMIDPVVKSSENQNFTHQNVGSGVSSLAQLMSEHEQKRKGKGVYDTKQGLGVPSLSSLTITPNSPPSIMSNQSSLSLGTLASLNRSSVSHSSAPSLLSVSLSSLSLDKAKLTANSSLAAPPGFGNLSSVFRSNPHSVGIDTRGRATVADPKGSPSLADLIQEHSNRSPNISNSSLTPHSCVASVQCQGMTAPAQMLSLSELASQHQNKGTHIQSQPQGTERPANITPTCLGGAVSLSQLAVQHQTKCSLASPQPQPISTESIANALKQPPGLSELLSLSRSASEDKGKTSTTSNGSHYSLTSLLSPAKPERADVLAEGTIEGGTKHKLDHKPYHQNSKPLKLDQTIDLSALMAHGASSHPFDNDLPSPSSLAPASFGLDSSVFARPSVFAITLSLQSRIRPKRTRNMLKGKIRGSKTGSCFQAFLCKLQNPKEQLTPLSPIVPFRFDTPSPDDIVRANQRKAFTR